MLQLFFASLGVAIGPLLRIALVQLGIGIITFTAITGLLNSLFTSARNAYNGLPGDIAALAQIGGIGEAMGIVAAAVGVRIGMQFAKRFGVLPS